jgi:histidyl-tRNA synthetase
MNIKVPKGTFDILPADDWHNSSYWSFLESVIRSVAGNYGFKEIRTPVFEKTELFQRGVGETTDIVTKEMYTFEDRAKRSMTLRPEGTASVMRSVIENHLYHKTPYLKLFYIGPMFRYERPQGGRYRQHHQFGLELIGHHSPEADVEVIDMIHTLYSRLGLKDLTIHLNSIGNGESRINFRQALCDYLQPHLSELSEESQRRFATNPLRILDSKAVQDQEITQNAPSILDFLDEASKKHFDEVQRLLQILEIPYKVNSKLVRGLDYYTSTVFEITSGQLGAQNSVGGGGRYDGLIKSLGGPDLPAVGYAMGMERVLQTMLGQDIALPTTPGPKVFLIPLGDNAREKCFELTHQLRKNNILAEMDLSGKKLKNIMQYANNISAKNVLIIGDEELANNSVEIKHMADGTKEKIVLSEVIRKFTNV